MAAFRRRDRPKEGYQIRPTLPPPWGRVGPWQTGFLNRRQAEQVEAWLKQVALERPDLIDALVRGDFSLRAAWVAKVRTTPQRDAIKELLEGLTDPPLAAAAAAFAESVTDDRVAHGLRELGALADAVEKDRAKRAKRTPPRPGTVRLSWLLATHNVNDLYATAIATGRSANSVRRSVHRAVADLLAHHYGKARRNEVMVDVKKPAADDERKVMVTGEEIAAALAECDVDFRDLAALAILLAVDRGPLLRITPRYFHEEEGTLEVLDSKTTSRPRTIELSTPAWAILRRRCADRKIDERIFDYSEDQVRHRWEGARDRAAGRPSRNLRVPRGRARDQAPAPDPIGAAAERLLAEQGVVTLPVLRFKDLRHLLPTAWNALGFPEADLQEIMGHAKGSKQTRRYITARIAGDRDRMDQVATFFGLDRFHIRAAGE